MLVEQEEGRQTGYNTSKRTVFIVTGLHINPGHTILHVISNQGQCVYFFLYCPNCLDLVIVKPQVWDTYQQYLTGFLQPAYASPSGRARHMSECCTSEKQEAGNIVAALSQYVHPWQPCYPSIVLHLGNTCSPSSLCFLQCGCSHYICLFLLL